MNEFLKGFDLQEKAVLFVITMAFLAICVIAVAIAVDVAVETYCQTLIYLEHGHWIQRP